MSKNFVGRRRSTEASIVLSSVYVSVQPLDGSGDPVGDEIELGRITVDKTGERVSLEVPADAETASSEAPGFKLFVRERGRESRTNVVELLFEDTLVPDPDPDPTPDTTKPSTPGNLRATSVNTAGFTLEWDPATDDVGVTEYDLTINNGGPGIIGDRTRYVLLGDAGTYAIELHALDAAGNASEVPATLTVTIPTPPPPDPDPEPTTWPAAGTVGFKGNASTLQRMRSGAIRTAGTVIENKRIDCSDGELGIYASNVTIRNCIIDAGIWGIFLYNSGANLVVEDCTFIGGYQAGIGLSQAKNWRISRCDFSGGRDAIKPGGSGVIEDCRMHDPDVGGDAHNDCLQFSITDGVIVRRNYLAGADTSCIAMFEGQGTYKNVTIENNWMGGAGYLIYAGGTSGSNIVIRNNTMGSYGYQHPVTSWVRKAGNVFTGNELVSGAAVNEP